MTTPPPSPPTAPRLRPAALPEIEDEPVKGPEQVTEDTDISTLTTAQVFDLNQSLLDEATGVTRPLIDEIAPISTLRAEYENGSPAFVRQIDWLTTKGYHYIRRTKGDGDCFYRSVAFAYVERMMHALNPAQAVEKGVATLKSTLPMLENVGFQRLAFEDFYDVLESLLLSIVTPQVTGKTLNAVGLLEAFQSPEVSNSIVVYLRLLTSAQIRIDPDAFAPFLFHPELGEPMEVREFCEHFVEAVNKEADHVQMTALSKVLQLNVNVAYLDGRNSNGLVDFVEFRSAPDANETPLALLYRPGHYDILVDSE
ncbi:cysteine proteinase [Guyanagaster necrorhizus]|uniref:ubiquitinyl hydrolase 1 n=1 Tax=Guyanagaster necrorhizus TaxID=856835 RepID=A0A9P8ATP5_9AGAR|nr:cysteine proteinase [Guyanagaster necrorhizus MCA 3950]KAG7447231.1 cysteine proteinase [Guyanagaster necrorhizus MCA 3950]